MSLANATRSELTKQFTTAAWWIMTIVLFAYLAFIAGGFSAAGAASRSAQIGNDASFSWEGLPSLVYSLATSLGYVFPFLYGTLIATAEMRHNTIVPTFLATPKRGVVLTAKAVSGVVMGAFFAVVALLATVGVGAGVLAAFKQDTFLSSGETWSMLARIVLAYVLWTVIGVGVGALIRNQLAAVVVVLVFSQFIEPILRLASGTVESLRSAVHYLPGGATDVLVGHSLMNPGAGSSPDAPEWWVGAVTLAAYAVVFLVLARLFSFSRPVV